jgi:hypothetical protein
MSDDHKTDPSELTPSDSLPPPESTPRVPLSPYGEMLQAAVRHQQQAEIYRRLLVDALERGDVLETRIVSVQAQLAQTQVQLDQALIDLGESKVLFLDAKAVLLDASTTFLRVAEEIKKNCSKHYPPPEPEEDKSKTHLSMVP